MTSALPLFPDETPTTAPSGRPAHRFIRGPFSALATELFESIDRLQATDPFRRVEVVVPSNWLGVDLRRRFAEWIARSEGRAGHANVRFSTFLDVARATAGPVAGKPAPAGILFAAVAGAVATEPAASPFRGLLQRPGFLRSVEATVRDLRDAGVSAAAFSMWAGGVSDRARRDALESLARVYGDVSRRLAAYADDVAIFRAAAIDAPWAPSEEPLLVFGFYDLTGLQRDLVAALAKSRPLEVFFPDFEGELGRFADRTRDFLSIVLGSPTTAAMPVAEASKDEWFRRLAGGPGNSPLPADGSLRLVSAADDTDEAREVAREILLSHADGIPLGKTAVVLRQEETDGPRFLAELARAGIPAFRLAGETGSESAAGRAIRAWLSVEPDGFRREDVLDVLELVETARGGSDAALFRLLASQAGIVRGADDWNRGTERLTRARPEEEGAEDADRRSGSLARTEQGRLAAMRLAEAWAAVRDSATAWSEELLPWAAWGEELRRRIDRLFGPTGAPEEITSAADAVASLDSSGDRVGREVALETFVSSLARQRVPGGRLGRDGVAILSAMAVRGLSFDHVLVPGLVERKFPAIARPDPLLFDEEREELANVTGRPLSQKVFPRPDEERFVFAACADSAARRLTLLAARRDASLDRERTPSQLFTRAVDASEGRPVETADYAGERRPASLRVTKLGVAGEGGPALNASEARRKVLRLHGASTLAHAFPPLARAREAAGSRRRPEYGPFEGRIRDADLLASAHARLSEKPLSPSAIEMFVKCPYRFFFARVLKLRAFDEASERGEVDDLGRGSLFHDAARRIAWERRGMPFGSLEATEAGLLSRRHAADALEAWEEENGYRISPPLLREIAEARLVEQLEAWLRHERDHPGNFAPTGAEVRFGPRRSAVEDPVLSSDEPVTYVTDSGEWTMAGRIDLVAVSQDGKLLRVTDFKVPRKLTNADRIDKAAKGKGRFVFGGELSQLPVYAEFAALKLAGSAGQPQRIRGEYLFVAPDATGGSVKAFPVGFDVEPRGALLQNFQNVMNTMEAAIRQGVFRPRTETFASKTPCFFCDYQTVCGPGHKKRYAAKAEDADPGVRMLAALEDLE